MAYDEALAQRVREVLAPRGAVSEREMFGGIAFMLAGNMACGVIGDDLLVRLGKEDAARALEEPHVRPMDFTGRPMKTTVYVDPRGHGRRRRPGRLGRRRRRLRRGAAPEGLAASGLGRVRRRFRPAEEFPAPLYRC